MKILYASNWLAEPWYWLIIVLDVEGWTFDDVVE